VPLLPDLLSLFLDLSQKAVFSKIKTLLPYGIIKQEGFLFRSLQILAVISQASFLSWLS
jgi:hypothetical protein